VDPLSRVIELVTVEAAISTRLEAGGIWALSFPGVAHIKFGAIHCGEAWLRPGPGRPEQYLRAGDCFVLATGAGYTVANAPDLEPVDGLPAFRAAVNGLARLGTADEVVMTGGRFVFDDESARLLLDVLPPLLIIGADQENATSLRTALELFAHETAKQRPGSALVTTRLGQIVFVEALRAAVDAEDRGIRGWLAALADDQIGTALHLMYEDPARHWTVPQLASTVQMSRSTFANRFRSLVGAPPLEHLLRLRMHIAGHELRRSSATVSTIGTQPGYTSDAAFSNAFKRVMGVSPSAWRARDDVAPLTGNETDATMRQGRWSTSDR